MHRLLAIIAAAVLCFGCATTRSFSADVAPVKLPAKAKPFAAAAPLCGATGCMGWHVDFSVMNAGTGVNILNLGSINANGTFLGVGGGYQYWDGSYWAGARVMGAYDVAGSGNVGNVGNLFGFEGVELGGNLFGLFGLAPPQTNGVLSALTSAIPTADIGACQHGKASGYCAGASLHYFLPNTPLEIRLSYLNAQYGTTNIVANQTMSVENLVQFGATYHFP